ncbi:uncharacterized protein LOC144638836 isoform X1 [Oculina patagonica]
MSDVGEGHKFTSGGGVYCFIHDLIIKGKDARFVDGNGRFAINWASAPMHYHTDFKSRTDNISDKKASNNLRSALLNSYEKEGAKEYKESHKKNEKGEIIERQFQMPPRILKSLFGSEVSLTDYDSKQETDNISSEVCKSSHENPTSSDTGFDEAMDTSCDGFFSNSEQDGCLATGGNPTDGFFLDNTKSEANDFNLPETHDLTEEDIKYILHEICSEEVEEFIDPSAGPLEGGLSFKVTSSKKLPEDDTSEVYEADFYGLCAVPLTQLNQNTLAGVTPYFLNISDPDDGLSYVTSGILTDGSLLDNTNSAEMDLDPPDITIPSFEIFNEEELKEPIDEICFKYPYNYNDQKKVAIYPLAGSIEGGLRFDITLTKTIPEDNTSERYLAEFDGARVVYLKKSNPTTLTGITPKSTLKPGRICVRVKTQAGKLLGLTDFYYVDHKTQEVLKRLYKDEALQSLYATLYSQEQSDGNFGLDQGPLIMHDQGKKQL